jgi:hypothetical protein
VIFLGPHQGGRFAVVAAWSLPDDAAEPLLSLLLLPHAATPTPSASAQPAVAIGRWTLDLMLALLLLLQW